MEYYPVTYRLSDGSVINVHIEDTCGQERFDSICESYYKDADGVLLVYDIANKKSFDRIKLYYVNKIKEKCKKGIPIILLGNKTDLEEKREVSQQDAINLSIEQEYSFKETSCSKNENVADAFETIIEMWNINNKKKNQRQIKRTKSKEYLTIDNNNDSSSFVLSERNSYNRKIDDDEGEEKKNQKLKITKKKKRGFC